MGDRKARRRMMRSGGDTEMELAGKTVKPEENKKSLGAVISENMNWTAQVNIMVQRCKFKLRSLKKLKGVVTEDHRRNLAELTEPTS